MKLHTCKHFLLTSFISFFLVACHSQNHTQIEMITLLETTESWNGKPLPKYDDGKPKITILKVIIPAKTKLETHKHSVINAAVILRGELSVITELNDTLRLKAGDACTEVVDTWHYGINNGEKPAELIVFYAGIEGNPNTILKKVEQR